MSRKAGAMKFLVLLLMVLAAPVCAQEEEEKPTNALPVDDPFIVRSRINFVYNNSVAENQEGSQSFTVNPVFALDARSSLQVSAPMVWYQGGQTGNLPGRGFGDFSVQYFRRFDTSEEFAHGLGVNLTFDTATDNLGGSATTPGIAYAFEYRPADSDNKLVFIAGYRHSMGLTTPGDPTRQLALRVQGYHYFDDAYAGFEMRNQFDLYTGQYQPLFSVTGGGPVFDQVQLWGAIRVPLSETARSKNDRLNYSIGITVPL
jgi:hypothetical protein